ncbi:MAG TPA: BamA/TamA family outer membrane protein [Longimicrobiales bacterium]|nr:BamA/TamA family outer membrane protein [Longimicrobiales bacterium]
MRTTVETRRGRVCLLLAVLAALPGWGCALRSPGAGATSQLERHAGENIGAVAFRNTGPYTADTLRTVVQTKPTRCNLLGLPICIPFTSIGRERHALDPGTVTRDVQRLELFYRIGGFFGTRAATDVQPAPDRKGVVVTFVLAPGDSVFVDSLRVVGTDTILPPDSAVKLLPLKPGELFNLGAFQASSDTLLRRLTQHGHTNAQVLRNYTVAGRRAVAELEAIPGPQVRVDSILVVGTENLSRATVLRQLEFRRGDLLVTSRLTRSQRNLYNLDLVQVASVAPAPDSLQPNPADSTHSAVLVQVVEAPEHQVEAAVGFGTVECFRGEGSWVDRSFLGSGGRRLELRVSASKLGVNTGLRNGICQAYQGDPAERAVDYRIGGTLTQPYFLSPRNTLSLSGTAERQSEPNTYQRIGQSGQLSVGRTLSPQEVLTAAVSVGRGLTRASPAFFCNFLLVCTPEDVEQLQRERWSNRLGVRYALDRANAAVDPSRGYRVGTGLDWSARWLGSTASFVRWTGDGERYHALRPGWVVAASLRLGSTFRVVGDDPRRNFLAPEERFYAGGAYSVRGFGQNGLGPGVYVSDTVPERLRALPPDSVDASFVPLGGTAFGIANLELRLPSPVFPERMRLALFVDAGSVSLGTVGDLAKDVWRVTPGGGARIGTPVGPLRLDVAYNPYGPTRGPLYGTLNGDLVRVADGFEPPGGGFLSHFRLHLAVGQAF